MFFGFRELTKTFCWLMQMSLTKVRFFTLLMTSATFFVISNWSSSVFLLSDCCNVLWCKAETLSKRLDLIQSFPIFNTLLMSVGVLVIDYSVCLLAFTHIGMTWKEWSLNQDWANGCTRVRFWTLFMMSALIW